MTGKNNRRVRVGIDVGGTHTKAVAINNETQEIIGKSTVKTTHTHELGVAAGVALAFQHCLEEYSIAPEEVVFVAHSTTQATNALVEGDVAHVGVVGSGGRGIEGLLAKRQLRIDDITLDNRKNIKIDSVYIKQRKLSDESISDAVKQLSRMGTDVVVSSVAFGVDNQSNEYRIAAEAESQGLPATIASNITKLYGLGRRTRTACINASILPKMLNTAVSTEKSVREVGVEVPLMIMRGDGGVMDIEEMKKRPILTMLSGPAASVMGSLMYLRASNGIYFEVGGTTTNVGVIKNGRPAIDYTVIGGHSTFVNSLDVRVVGDAGGSMVRMSGKDIVDVGPRSAHIAGLDYACYTDQEEIVDPEVELFSPKPGDPSDYIAIKLKSGKRITVTNSCAANVLGYAKPGDFSYGDPISARKAIQPIADSLGITVEEVATKILERASAKIIPLINQLCEKYSLDISQISLVGIGGGAAALIGVIAEKLNCRYSIPENAEVISSIGVALAMVRDMVERLIPNPQAEDLKNIRNEVAMKAVESGADPDSIEVHIEIDSQTSKVTAIATGSTEVKTAELMKPASEAEKLEIASKDMRVDVEDIKILGSTPFYTVYGIEKKNETALRVLDAKGFIKVQCRDGQVIKTKAGEYKKAVERLWDSCAVYKTEMIVRPDYYIAAGAKLMDFTSFPSLERQLLIMDTGLSGCEQDEDVLVIGAVQHN